MASDLKLTAEQELRFIRIAERIARKAREIYMTWGKPVRANVYLASQTALVKATGLTMADFREFLNSHNYVTLQYTPRGICLIFPCSEDHIPLEELTRAQACLDFESDLDRQRIQRAINKVKIQRGEVI